MPAFAGRVCDHTRAVPGAHHGFETVDDTDAARQAIRGSVAWFATHLQVT